MKKVDKKQKTITSREIGEIIRRDFFRKYRRFASFPGSGQRDAAPMLRFRAVQESQGRLCSRKYGRPGADLLGGKEALGYAGLDKSPRIQWKEEEVWPSAPDKNSSCSI